MYDGFCFINGVAFPSPSNESALQTIATVVDGARTADGVFRGQKVGRDQGKIELVWRMLEPEVWSRMLQIFDQNFTFTLRFYSMLHNGWIEREFYVGDRSARPFLVDKNTGRPKAWIECKANVIDTGR